MCASSLVIAREPILRMTRFATPLRYCLPICDGQVLRRCCVALAVAVIFLLTAGNVYAHGEPIPLAFWGGYSPGVARCQVAIGRVAFRCVRDVIATRRKCLDGSVRGTPCDTRQLDSDVAALRQASLRSLGSSCSSLQLQQLRYADLSEAYRDVIDVCRRLDTAATSAIYLPARVSGSVIQVNPAMGACIVSASVASAKLLDYSIRLRQQDFDRIAGTRLTPARKLQLVSVSGDRITRARSRLQEHVVTECAEEDFLQAYGRTVDVYLDGIASQGNCHAQYVYVQDAILCPPTSCGNGIQEPGEQCDDGNDRDGDQCLPDCRRAFNGAAVDR